MGSLNLGVIRQNGDLPNPRCIDATGVIPDLWEVYVDSAVTQLNDLEIAAMGLEAGKNPEENAASIRRILHSLKGDSGVTGLPDIYNLIHEAEFGFEELAGTEATDMVLKLKDWICEAISCIRKGETGMAYEDAEKAAKSSAGQSNDKIKTLVIDDQIVVCKLVEILLGNYCDMTFASDGSEGFELFKVAIDKGDPFQLITLDIEMPLLGGHETLEVIRDFERSRGIYGLDGVKVIMSSSLEDPGNIFSAFKEGCEAYVRKTEMDTKLVEEIRKLGLITVTV